MDFILNAIDKQLETFCHFLPNSRAIERSTHGQVQRYSHYNTMHKSCTCQLVPLTGKKNQTPKLQAKGQIGNGMQQCHEKQKENGICSNFWHGSGV